MGLEPVSLNVPKFPSLWMRCGSVHKQGVKKILDILDAAYCKELEATTASPISNLESSSSIDFPCQFHISGSAKFVLIEVGMKSQVTNDLREMILQKLTTSGRDDCLLPSDNYPDWFTFNHDDSYVTFEVPHVDGGILKSMTLCIVYSSSPDTIISECLETVSIQNYTQFTTHVYDRDTLASSKDEEWQTIMSNLEPGDMVEIGVVSGKGFIAKKTAVYLIFDAPTDQNTEQQTDVIVSRDNDTVIGGDENTSPVAVPTASLSDSPDLLGKKITAQNQEHLQLQETPMAPNTKYTELTLTAKGVEKTHETSIVCPTSLDMPSDPISTITTIIPSMGAEDDELDEDGEILAELDKILSESYISPPKKVDSAASESEVKSLPVITIFNSIQGLLDNQLEILVADGDIKKQLLECLAQLGRMKSQVPTNLQPLVTDIKKFYEEVVNNFPSVQEVLGNHQRLIDTKNRLEEELETAKARQAHFSASISKGKERLSEMSKEITDLEEKLKALSEKREKLQSTLKLSETANQNINEKVATLLKESKEVVSDLKASKSAFEEAESSKQNYDRKLVDLKQALGNIRP